MKNLLLIIVAFVAFSASAQTSGDKIFRTTEVDAKPELQNGMYTLTMFVSQNFQFPEIKNKKIRIFTSFIVEPDGTMHDEKAFYISVKENIPSDVVKIQTEEEKAAETKLYEGMRHEAARVLAMFDGKWTPAQAAGKPVRCLYNYPISFNIE
jgi:hypothetical protein